MLKESPLDRGHDVLDVLARRKRGGAPQANEKLGLVVEGGGMRSVVGAGMALALNDAETLESFDAVYATSGGAITASYFVSRQARLGASLFTEDLTSSEFMNWCRVSLGRPMMSMDYLFEAIANRKSLDLTAVRRAPLHVLATTAHEAEPLELTPFESDEEVLAGLRATCTIPVISGHAVPFRSGFFFDGGIHESVPFRAAIEDGCTHVLVLVTRPWHGERARPSILHRGLARYIRKHYGVLADAFLERLVRYPEDLAFLEKVTSDIDATPKICAVAPDDLFVKVFERRERVLRRGIEAGYAAMARALLAADRSAFAADLADS